MRRRFHKSNPGQITVFRGSWKPTKDAAVGVDSVGTGGETSREATGAATDPPADASRRLQVRAMTVPPSTRDPMPARAGTPPPRDSSPFKRLTQKHPRTDARKYRGNRGGLIEREIQASTYRAAADLNRDFRRLVRDSG